MTHTQQKRYKPWSYHTLKTYTLIIIEYYPFFLLSVVMFPVLPGVHWKSKQTDMLADWFKVTHSVLTTSGVETNPFFLQCIKNEQKGGRVYGWHPDRKRFFYQWATWDAGVPRPAVFELVRESQPCRLYLDVEMVFDVDQGSAWIRNFIDIIGGVLVANGVPPHQTKSLVVSGCRPQGEKYKMSYHVIYPMIFCMNNHLCMKGFIDSCIIPVFLQNTNYTYISKDGASTCVDARVYTRNRLFRICMAPKNPNPTSQGLQPYDSKNGTILTFVNPDDLFRWLLSSTLTGFDQQGCYRITPKPQQVKRPKPSHRNQSNRGTKGKRRKITCLTSDYLQILLCTLLPLLGLHRAQGSSDFFHWVKVGWVIADIFNGDEVGRSLFHLFSSRHSEYSFDSADVYYKPHEQGARADNACTVGTIRHYARQDSPILTNRLLKFIKRIFPDEDKITKTQLVDYNEFISHMAVRIIFLIMIQSPSIEMLSPVGFFHPAITLLNARRKNTPHTLMILKQLYPDTIPPIPVHIAFCILLHTSLSLNRQLTLENLADVLVE